MIRASIVALVTPMQLNGAIDYDRLDALIEWHLQNKTNGLVILGTTGESATIANDEREKIIRHAITTVNHRIPVIVGVGSNATAETIARTEEAKKLNADAVLIVTPYYNKPTQEGLFQHFSAIANISIAQILYNVPSRTACDLLPETVARLSVFSNIIGVKEATGDMQRLQKLLSLCPSLDYFSGDDKTAMEFILQGGKGVISVAANVVPQKIHALCDAALTGDRLRAESINQSLEKLYHALFVESNPIPTKWALAKMSLIQLGIRLPLTPLNVAHQPTVSAAIEEVLCDVL
ncbi:MAG: hypothetical protein ACD_42C00196G0001 [uncultured bacterium]|nr:MAG: hypothetical protein ACD_42C00196G0001 [uncultured bacterium]OGT26763.1 MAG: 4-hydroxy-tetrahydrodipicolinate synthase [Gammaproteobacteria bacterium RIFCSPHIGHO2_02_FULL_42_43]OGT27485.1 MAG: 4-hydroxy-tetrahydrodipicolinate synthase [Gammaproteobacteria bacterium RIFCSPHIGHO2_01_FULL_42_8]OGT52929.1 MAG: 4-hydroxy-tetrahydrodipicolinate synthase [Gammaproteobacteria bacterium RIFCSPHIGHO2_12_FULL_41_25]OGT61297.1 MAG: 4-hydroxy-tetrahydrodipicolinate synthase [Gammaproteobacteria bact